MDISCISYREQTPLLTVQPNFASSVENLWREIHKSNKSLPVTNTTSSSDYAPILVVDDMNFNIIAI